MAQNAYLTGEQLGIPPPEEGDYDNFIPDADEDMSLPSYDKEISALDTPVDRTGQNSTDKPDATIPAKTDAPADVPLDERGNVILEQPQEPIADWKERAEKANMKVSSEQEFREQLQLSQYVQENFYADPLNQQLYGLLYNENVPARQILEFDIKQSLDEDEGPEDVEEKLTKYVDEDGELTPKGELKLAAVRKRMEKTIGERAAQLAESGRTYIAERKAFDTTLADEIKSLPAEQFAPADKKALHSYIQSGQYERDALLIDEKGVPLNKGAEQAKKLLANAQLLNPVFQEKRLKALYADAKQLGVDEFIKKNYK